MENQNSGSKILFVIFLIVSFFFAVSNEAFALYSDPFSGAGSLVILPGTYLNLGDPNSRSQYSDYLKQKAIAEKDEAWELAKKAGWKTTGLADGRYFELVSVKDFRPVYKITNNAKASELSGANILHDPNFFSPPVLGTGLTVGLWDGGWAFEFHQEFGGRVKPMLDNPIYAAHATHVAGTIGAAGIDPNAKGMAPDVFIDSYDWNWDTSEMASRAATVPGEGGMIYLSNHSYGYVTGWEYGFYGVFPGDFDQDGTVDLNDLVILANSWLTNDPYVDIVADDNDIVNFRDFALMAKNWRQCSIGWYWFGTWGEREDRFFGQYSSETGVWDNLCYNADYYLPFKSAGNDRNDDAPPIGTYYWYLDPNALPDSYAWKQKMLVDEVNDPNVPYDDGWDNGGFDTVTTVGAAKNIITVGAVDDFRGMAGFSGWGPTDDGRIKPDIVANGVELYSTIYTGDINDTNSYDGDGWSGTSMSCASASGSAALIVDYYNSLGFENHAMRASTLKALIIHTAEDLGNAGPDYRFGWGLIDANAAAGVIKNEYDDPNTEYIIEQMLTSGSDNKYRFIVDGDQPFKATICWSDPPADEIDELDNRTPRLVNDLDLRIVDDANEDIVYFPYMLDPNDPAADANTGDNFRDNVEQVNIASLPTGTYTAHVTHKGTLAGGIQNYSLIMSIPRPIKNFYVDDNAPDDPAAGDPTSSDPLEDGTIEHPFDCIQEAIDQAANGDTIKILDGIYKGAGNYDIDTAGKAVELKSLNGPANCMIDCEYNGRAFVFQNGEGSDTQIWGIRIENGYAKDSSWPRKPEVSTDGFGGAILCVGSSPLFIDCVINWNQADSGGGAVFCYQDANPLFWQCQLSWNQAGVGLDYYYVSDLSDAVLLGGAVYAKDSAPAIAASDITDNRSVGSGGAIASEDSDTFILWSYIGFNDCWTSNQNITQHGGGVYCNGGQPAIYESEITLNSSRKSAGGVAVWDSDVYVGASYISDNTCLASGGGVFVWGPNSVFEMENSIVARNTGIYSGGIGILYGGFALVKNCTIVNNDASYDIVPNYSGGIHCYDNGSTEVVNSILWANTGEQIVVDDVASDSNAVVTYSDVQMFDANGIYDPAVVWPGEGNLNDNPLFIRLRFDYHLQSTAGRWDDAVEDWVLDSQTSPCIDAGDPSGEYILEPTPNGSRVNMGAYGNTYQASKSP